MATVELMPGVALDADRHKWAAALAQTMGSECLFGGPTSAVEVVGLVDLLLAALEALPQEELAEIWSCFESDRCELSPSCSTPQQAAGMASAVFGLHRFDPSAETHEALVTLQAVAEVIAAPVDSAESNALLALALVARARWRGQGLVRNPRRPTELLNALSLSS